MSLTRRDLLKMGALGTAALAMPLERSARAVTANRMAESALPLPFTVPFVQPPQAKPIRSDATTDYYRISMREGSVEILPGYRTRIWGYDGTFPGPTFDVQQGRTTVVRQMNQINGPHPTLGYVPHTSVHLHGSASLPQYDGYASDITWPGFYKDYRYPNVQDARTLWYHDHGVHQTNSNVYMGLAGLYRIHDPLEQSLPLPQGMYDVPLVVSDAMFDAGGQLLWDDGDQSGLFGDVILVNGRPWPVMQVERRKYRFRILNASVTRTYRFRLDTGDPLVVVGTDGGLTPYPQPVRELRHGNAERYEVVIDFSRYRAGQRVVLQNVSPKNNVDYTHTDKVMAFEVTKRVTSKAGNSVPDVLHAANPTMALQESAAAATRVMELVRSNGRWTINGQTWDDVVASGFTSTLANPALGDVEVWEIRNDSGGWHHPLHIHLIDFRVLGRDVDRTGVFSAPYAFEQGPKDVVYVGENERVRVVARYGPHRGKYMVHCHNLVHEDHDMMGQFWVSSPDGWDPVASAPPLPLPGPAL